MDYGPHLYEEFARRTLENLRLIENSAKLDEAFDHESKTYEVTQLINSLLGLLVFPQQRYHREIPETPLKQLVEEGWPIPKVDKGFKDAANLRDLFRMLRNAIAHSNIEFLAGNDHGLRGLKLWNQTRDGTINWKVTIKLKELRKLPELFLKEIGINRNSENDEKDASSGTKEFKRTASKRPNRPENLILATEAQQAIINGTLFYPACELDIHRAFAMFRPLARKFVFVDPKIFRNPGIQTAIVPPQHRPAQWRNTTIAGFEAKTVEFPSGRNSNKATVTFVAGDGEEIIDSIETISVYMHRRDTLAKGEGSSGVAWLGPSILARVIEKMPEGGIIVTDGSCISSDGPVQLAQFYSQSSLGAAAIFDANPFEYAGKTFRCVGYAGESIGPTLIWQVSS